MRSSFAVPIVLAMVVACCMAAPKFRRQQLLATDMANEQVLDDNNQFILRWTILDETSEIVFEMEGNCTGWLGIVLTYDQPFTRGSLGDLFMGGYNDVTGEGFIEDRYINLLLPTPGDEIMDDHQDVTLVSASYNEPWTTVRFVRSLNTTDTTQDVPIVAGEALVSWTLATDDDTTASHDPADAGFARVTFISA